MDPKTVELRDAHDVLAAFYVDYLDGWLDRSPVDRAVLDLFCELTRAVGPEVADVGCGTGHLMPHLASRGLAPRGVDLSPEMVRVARRNHPRFVVEQADLRALPFADDSLDGALAWYSMIFLPPGGRAAAYAELARVVRPGGYLLVGFKVGDGNVRRRGRNTGLDVEFDVYWLPSAEMEGRATDAGFETVFTGGVPAESPDTPAQGYLLARRVAATASTETSAQAGTNQTGTTGAGFSAAEIQSPVV